MNNFDIPLSLFSSDELDVLERLMRHIHGERIMASDNPVTPTVFDGLKLALAIASAVKCPRCERLVKECGVLIPWQNEQWCWSCKEQDLLGWLDGIASTYGDGVPWMWRELPEPDANSFEELERRGWIERFGEHEAFRPTAAGSMIYEEREAERKTENNG